MPNYCDPAESVAILDALEQSGFDDASFAVIHHHNEPQTISAHRAYCAMLIEGEDQFVLTNNQLVQQRLRMILTMYRSAGFSSGRPEVFYHLARAALSEVPHDLRPLVEQASAVRS